MKKKTIIGLFAGLFLVLALQNVSAYHNDGIEVTIGFDDSYSRDYRYVDSYYGYPQYRVYGDYASYPNGYSYYNRPNYFGYNSRYRYDLSDIKRYFRNRAIAGYVDRSAYSRYDINYGKDSQVFCEALDCEDKAPSPTNFRYRYTYDPRIDGLGSYQDYYYEPQYDIQTGTYNWRY